MIITSEFFSFNVWEWFLCSSVLERTESDLSKINWLCGVILLIPIVLVPWGRFPMCHTPIKPISAFWDQISILIVGCVITRFASDSVFIQFFSFVHISDRFVCYSRYYHCSFILLVFWFFLLLELYIHIWIALLSWFYLVLVSVLQEPQEGDTRGMSMWWY
jgi:hypothetical protein